MTKKPSESSKEPSKSSDPPSKEPTNYLADMVERLNKELRDSGRIVKEVGPLDIQGSQFIFPARKSRKEATPPASDVVAPTSDEEV
jgi:hypothetical protein